MSHALITIYGVSLIALLVAAHDHGKPRTGKHNFWTVLVGNVVNLALLWWALGWKLY